MTSIKTELPPHLNLLLNQELTEAERRSAATVERISREKDERDFIRAAALIIRKDAAATAKWMPQPPNLETTNSVPFWVMGYILERQYAGPSACTDVIGLTESGMIFSYFNYSKDSWKSEKINPPSDIQEIDDKSLIGTAKNQSITQFDSGEEITHPVVLNWQKQLAHLAACAIDGSSYSPRIHVVEPFERFSVNIFDDFKY